MSLEIGSRLGHYDVTALIGEGGMGQVDKATDTRLSGELSTSERRHMTQPYPSFEFQARWHA